MSIRCILIADVTKPSLIVTSHTAIVHANIDLHSYVAIPLLGVRSIAGLDVHVAKQQIYFSDSAQKRIYRVNVDGSNLTEVGNGLEVIRVQGCCEVMRGHVVQVP